MRLRVQYLLALMLLVAQTGCCLQAAGEGGTDGGGMDAGVPDSGQVVIPNNCVILDPSSLNFGSVEVNSSSTKSLALTNGCGIDVSVTVGDLKGTDPLLFVTAPAAGTVLVLHAKETTLLTVQFVPLVASPTEALAYFAIKICSSGTGCEPLVGLRGTPVNFCLLIEPSTLDFGPAIPGVLVPRFVTLANVCHAFGDAPIHLTADPVILNTDSSGGHSPLGPFQPGAGFPPKDTALPPGQSVQIPVYFTPPAIGKFIGELDFSTDDPTFSNVTIPITGFGGGGVISCAPAAVDFGLDAVGIGTTLPIVCTNVGTDIPGNLLANLFIPNFHTEEAALRVEGGDAAFQPSLPNFPVEGLAAGESATIYVEYLPTVAGTNSDTLVISSNSAGGSDTLIPLTGECQ